MKCRWIGNVAQERRMKDRLEIKSNKKLRIDRDRVARQRERIVRKVITL